MAARNVFSTLMSCILNQRERTGWNCFLPSSGAGGRIAERNDVVNGSTMADRLNTVPDCKVDLRSCQIYESVSAEYDDSSAAPSARWGWCP